MNKYEIHIFLDNEAEIILPVQYEKDYDLRRDITNIGVNGILQKIDKNFEYYPPHRINKINVVEVLT